MREAERAAGRSLIETDGRWARAFARILVGQPAWSVGDEAKAGSSQPVPRRSSNEPADSIWQTLGVAPDATTPEIKRAFQKGALATHPDHGGEVAKFLALRGAYTEALHRRARAEGRPTRKRH